MNKRHLLLLRFYCLTAGIILAISLRAQTIGENVPVYRERLYISTDKPTYIAGESLWLSLFCFDASTHTPSTLSSIAYLELQDSQKSVLQAKAELQNGRGSACLSLSPSLPTGNYRLVAYTRYMQNEDLSVFFTKVISIYNTLSPEKMLQEKEAPLSPTHQAAPPILSDSSPIQIQIASSAKGFPVRSAIPVSIHNQSDQPISYSISIYATDSLEYYRNPGIKEYLGMVERSTPRDFSNRYIADYEGEIIRGRIVNERSGATEFPGKKVEAYLSVVGPNTQLYNGKIDPDGNVAFFTKSVYGNSEVVTELYPRVSELHRIVLNNAFAEPAPVALPELTVREEMESTLLRRSLSMQIEYRFLANSLHIPIVPLPNPTFEDNGKVYMLDEYTRFPLMKEVITEFVPEARFRTSEGKTSLMVRDLDAFGKVSLTQEKALVLLDGIPILDHEKIYTYDPMLVKSLTVYEGYYQFGNTAHPGVAIFKTYTGLYPTMTFEEDVRISNFNGVQYPLIFKGPVYQQSGNDIKIRPDWRHTLYWNANLATAPGEEEKITCYSSDYTGDFVAVIEGMSADGRGFRQECTFTVIP